MISVLLCVKDGERFIRDTISSILKQTYSNFELIIVVNCTTDKTIEVIREFNDDRIRLFETNIGQLSFNLNFAIMQSSGDYIARIDADDIANPERFEKQIKLLKAGIYDVVGSNVNCVDVSGRFVSTIEFPEENKAIRDKIYYRSVLAHPTIMLKKSLLLKNSGYLGGRFAQDYDLWLRIMRDDSVCFYNIQESLVSYRIHDGQSKGNMGSYAEVAGYLLRESIVSKSFKFFFGSFLYLFKAFIR